ncbi:hypothetical protein HHUSO_G24422 [Huso huso]|uniref:Uncharacterized protein n=1 Tax=Huso huso TaxID=61971 RepID=A0ABR0YR14_HUSHU
MERSGARDLLCVCSVAESSGLILKGRAVRGPGFTVCLLCRRVFRSDSERESGPRPGIYCVFALSQSLQV